MFRWKLRNEGDWVKNTENTENAASAMSDMDYCVLSPVHGSGSAPATTRTRAMRSSKPGGCFTHPLMPVRGQKYKLQSWDNARAPETDLSHALAELGHAQLHLP